MDRCPYCRAISAEKLVTREMMFGTRQAFTYSICNECSSAYLFTPLDGFALREHYPDQYYSHKRNDPSGRTWLKRYIKRCRGRYELGEFNLAGFALHLVKLGIADTWGRYGLIHSMRLLDVGCGSGDLLSELAASGVGKAFGCDPILKADVIEDGIRVFARPIEEMDGQFEFLMFNHSLEHVFNPEATLQSARRLQKAGMRCVVRCPTTSSDAFEAYRENWVQLDPPRHISLPSRDGMKTLSARCGYGVVDTIDDSSGFQFWGSEQYLRDIPLHDPRSALLGGAALSQAEMEAFEEKARNANKRGRGDQVAFLLNAI